MYSSIALARCLRRARWEAAMLGNGGPMSSEGLAIHLYACNADMAKEAFVNSDGDFLIVPVHGRLDIQTEFGKCVDP